MSQFTESEFSKPFACCGRWQQCDMGENEDGCFYRKSDTETMLNCRAYQRNQKENNVSVIDKSLEDAFTLFDILYAE